MLLSDASIDRLPVVWAGRRGWRPAAPLGLLALALVLESLWLGADHGTHLLVVLVAVLAVLLFLGPKPAFAGLTVAAGVAAAASMATAGSGTAVAHTAVQLLASLFVGSVSIALVMAAVHPRERPPTPRSAERAPMEATLRNVLAPTVPGLSAASGSAGQQEALTPRELEVLRLAATGLAVEEVARRLCVSPNTVKTHLTHIYGKLGVRGRSDAVRAGLHAGLLMPGDICPHNFSGSQAAESPVPVTTSTVPPLTM